MGINVISRQLSLRSEPDPRMGRTTLRRSSAMPKMPRTRGEISGHSRHFPLKSRRRRNIARAGPLDKRTSNLARPFRLPQRGTPDPTVLAPSCSMRASLLCSPMRPRKFFFFLIQYSGFSLIILYLYFSIVNLH